MSVRWVLLSDEGLQPAGIPVKPVRQKVSMNDYRRFRRSLMVKQLLSFIRSIEEIVASEQSA